MEDLLPPQTENGAAFEPPIVRQFSIFMENRVGGLQTLVRAYEEQSGRIMALSIQNSADTALVRVICSDPDLARNVFRARHFMFTEQELLAVELPKHSEPLVTICSALIQAEINIHYAYPLMVRPKGPVLVLYVDDPTLASQLLIKKGFTLLAESDLAKE